MNKTYCEKLKENHFMIVCGDCGFVLLEETYADSLTEACEKSMGYTKCPVCKSPNLILKYNFKCGANKYDAEHPYPEGKI